METGATDLQVQPFKDKEYTENGANATKDPKSDDATTEHNDHEKSEYVDEERTESENRYDQDVSWKHDDRAQLPTEPIEELRNITFDETGEQSRVVEPDSHLSQSNEVIDDNESEISDASDEMLAGDHELLEPLQVALHQQLSNAADRAEEALRDKSEEAERSKREREEVGVELYTRQQQLARLQMKLEGTHDRFNAFARLRTRAEHENQELTEILEASERAKNTAEEKLKQNNKELQQVQETMHQVEQYNEKMRSEILVTRRAAYAEEEEMQRLEKEKKHQDYLLASLHEQERSLKKHVETLESQLNIQKEQSIGARQTLVLAQKEMDLIRSEKSDAMMQWKSAVIALTRRDETVQAGEEVKSKLIEDVAVMESEHGGYVKAVREQHENHEKLNELLGKVMTDARFLERHIDTIAERRSKLAEEYSMLKKQLEEVDSELNELNAQKSSFELEVSRCQKKVEKSTSEHSALAAEIIENVSVQSSIEQGAQNTFRSVKKLRAQLQEVETKIEETQNEIARVKVDTLNTSAHNRELKRTIEEYSKELKSKDALVQQYEGEMSARHTRIGKKQVLVDKLNRRYEALTKDVDGADDNTGPLEASIKNMRNEITEKITSNAELQRRWIRSQTRLVELADEVATQAQNLRGLGARATVLQQKRYRLTGAAHVQATERKQLEKAIDVLHRSMAKLNEMNASFAQTRTQLSSDNHSIELEFSVRLKELEKESTLEQTRIDQIVQEKHSCIDQIEELEEQILMWERKIKLEKETQQALDPEYGQSEMRELRKEVNRMRLKLDVITKRQNSLITDMQRAIYKRDDIQIRNANSKRKDMTRAAIKRQTASLKSNLRSILKDVKAVEKDISRQENDSRILTDMLERVQTEYNDVEESTTQLSDRIHTAQLHKRIRIEQLKMLQSRRQRLEAVLARQFRLSVSAARVEDELQRQTDRTESAKEALRSLSNGNEEHEPSLDAMLSFMSSS